MDVLMPQLGETVTEGTISKWFVAAGDAVQPGDNLFEIETDKVSMEVPAISAGVISAINVAAGETAPVGAVVAIIQGAGETAAPASARPVAPTPLTPAQAGVQNTQELGPRLRGDERKDEHQAAPTSRGSFQMEPFREVRSPERNFGPARLAGGTVTTPLARRLAGEAGIDLSNLKGSGPRGRIVARDVEAARAQPARAPTQARVAANVVVTADVEIGQAQALCEGVPAIELADIVIKAWAAALQRITPSEKSDIALIGKGRAIIRDAAGRSLTAISQARGQAAETNDVSGTSTAISIAAVAGIISVTEVLQPPHTTMLCIGAPRRAPIEAADGGVKFVSVTTVTLSCDHRVVDGTVGAELLAAFKRFVEQPVTMIV